MFFSSYCKGQQGAANGQDSCGVFLGMHGALDGCVLARYQLKASTAMDLGNSNFAYFCMACGLEKGFVCFVKTDWSVI